MQSVNGAHFLNTSSLSPLFGLSPTCAAIDIVALVSIYNHYNHINLNLTLKF